jgi:voltage-gated potassium channel
MGSIFFIALRQLRLPLILIIVIYAISIAGLVLIPGRSPSGDPLFMSFFDAFYFVSYTATTIGFGEIPWSFTQTQRLWVTFIIYSSVVGWTFLIGGLLRLANDRAFQHAITAARFSRTVRFIREPFYIICGLGETGKEIVQALDRLQMRSVIIDLHDQPLEELRLEDLSVDPPTLSADATQPDTLIRAGILKKECCGVIILSQKDQTNLAIAVACALLHPGLPIISRVHSLESAQLHRQIGVSTVINPFEVFSSNLLMAILSPHAYRLVSWLTGLPGTRLAAPLPAPPGRWIVCGYGRFGSLVVSTIKNAGYEVVVVDPDETHLPGVEVVTGNGIDKHVLEQAGIFKSDGIVAGTDHDTDNLLIYLTAKELNPTIFTILRQNIMSNEKLFAASSADMVMVARKIIASECIAAIKTPLLVRFVALIRQRPDEWSRQVVSQLQNLLGDDVPEFWSVEIDPVQAPALFDIWRKKDQVISLKDLYRDLGDPDQSGEIMALLIARDGELIEMPSPAMALKPDDQILFAGSVSMKNDLRHLLLNINVARHVILGENALGGSVFRAIR